MKKTTTYSSQLCRVRGDGVIRFPSFKQISCKRVRLRPRKFAWNDDRGISTTQHEKTPTRTTSLRLHGRRDDVTIPRPSRRPFSGADIRLKPRYDAWHDDKSIHDVYDTTSPLLISNNSFNVGFMNDGNRKPDLLSLDTNLNRLHFTPNIPTYGWHTPVNSTRRTSCRDDVATYLQCPELRIKNLLLPEI